ncbi:MAG: thrombospondin type 3 repeat-containing protein [Nitrospirae bacterium]|nr:thrombospondin type 3 repeat-containing protein [Nitrospirota bacterium]
MKQRILSVLWIFLMLIVGFVHIPYAAGASVAVDPPTVAINDIGDTSTINIIAREVTNLQGFQFVVKFDPAVTKVNSTQINPSFPFIVRNVIDNVNGTVDLVASAFSGMNDDALLVTLNVEGVSFRTTSVTINNRVVNNVNLPILRNSLAAEIPITLSPGEITVGTKVVDSDGDGYSVEQGDCNDNDASIHPAAVEVCNGVDDNCDTFIDENVAIDDGNACTVDSCDPQGGVSHVLDPGLGVPEVCDGIDNDCDGVKDNGVLNACGTCGPVPSDDNCDGIDDDCDGTPDDEYVPVPTSCGAGACIAFGQMICVDTSLENTCQPVPGSPEVCDGADNDCDGIIDNGFDDTDKDGFADCIDPDDDNDGRPDDYDNCKTVTNADQSDIDKDGIGDVCDGDIDGDNVTNGEDNCQVIPNPNQANHDDDPAGDACDNDDDNDGISDDGDNSGVEGDHLCAAGATANCDDNCPYTFNPDQADKDGDGIGDACETDRDGDGVPDGQDNCPDIANGPAQANITGVGNQTDTDSDGQGDACDSDDDNDGKSDEKDNCPWVANADQANNDNDAYGDVCDSDDDNDGVLDNDDNCPIILNPDQIDQDGDGQGDLCDEDHDGDGMKDVSDNCPDVANPDQKDTDHDNVGDVCDPDDDNDGVADGPDNCPLGHNPGQGDADDDGIGDVCDDTCDTHQFCSPYYDTVCGTDGNTYINACEAERFCASIAYEGACDADGDGIPNSEDNCPKVYNPDQKDKDNDGIGDACEKRGRIDLALVKLEAPREIRECKKKSVPIHIYAKNNGTLAATGTVILYKDGEVVEVWHNVQFDLKKRRSVKLVYLYDPSGDGGRKVVWKASISADGDSKSKNNTAGTVNTRVKRCR